MKILPRAWLALACLSAAPVVHAQFAVIDVASVTQLIEQVQTLQQQLSTARSQLSQAQAQFQSMTGARGMEQLLAGTARNYLPTDWASLRSVAAGGGTFAALDASVHSALAAVSVLSAAQLTALAAPRAAGLAAQREDTALLQGVTEQALANSSGRFASLQQLIDAIGRAADEKAALDLQARIAAEAGMLQNESTKLQVLVQAVHADQQANAQRFRELAIAGHGQFGGRFQPQP